MIVCVVLDHVDSCYGADLSGCGPISMPDPMCDYMGCGWGSVSLTYLCPEERTCDMDCFGCNECELSLYNLVYMLLYVIYVGLAQSFMFLS